MATVNDYAALLKNHSRPELEALRRDRAPAEFHAAIDRLLTRDVRADSQEIGGVTYNKDVDNYSGKITWTPSRDTDWFDAFGPCVQGGNGCRMDREVTLFAQREAAAFANRVKG